MATSFVCTALLGTNKVGKLKPDSEGYYPVVLGAFETSNGHGDVYTFEQQTADLFKGSSQLMRQIEAGNLWGEWGHPKLQPGETMQAFIRRCLVVSESRYAFHIRKVYLDSESVKDKNGKAVVAVIGEIKPMGPFGPMLKEILDTPSANACFSVRAQTDDTNLPNGREQRSVKYIITWDYVGDPGVPTSTKYHSPKLESFVQHHLDLDLLENIRTSVNLTPAIKMENASIHYHLDAMIKNASTNPLRNGKGPRRSRKW